LSTCSLDVDVLRALGVGVDCFFGKGLEDGIGVQVACWAAEEAGAVMEIVLSLVIFRYLLMFDGVCTPLELRRLRYIHGT
jgi:hypothetical protein